jgi:hypothetical protein
MDDNVTLPPPATGALYDEDAYGWAMDQGRKLRAGRLSELDLLNLAEEIESMGRSEKRELTNRLTVLLTHLLKWAAQPSRHGRSWTATIWEQRIQAASVLRDNPSLRPMLAEILDDAYRLGRIRAYGETKLPDEAFPDNCPWTWDQVMDRDFLPEPFCAG